jgi:hypothetical protein
MAKAVGAVLVVEIDVEPEFDEEFNRWYDEEHIPQRKDYPGFLSAQRFSHPDRPNAYLAMARTVWPAITAETSLD